MAGLFSGSTNDVLSSIAKERLSANQALGSPYGKYAGIVQTGAGLADIGADATAGGGVGASDPRMQQMKEVQGIFSQVAQQVGTTTSSAFYDELAKKLTDRGYVDQAQKATEKAAEIKDKETKQTNVKSLAAVVMRKMPELSEEEAIALAADPKAAAELLKNPAMKPTVIETEKGQLLIDQNTGNVIAEYGSKPVKPSSLDKLASSMGALTATLVAQQAKEAGGAGGKEVGKFVAEIGSGYKADDAIAEAIKQVDSGIFAGGYGPTGEKISKYTLGMVGSKERLQNTEKFRAFIGNVVVPMMSQLGGSDSNEELKYMRQIAGGETTLEEKSIKGILERAQRAVKNDIARKQKQYEAVVSGKPLPTGPVGTEQQAKTSGQTKAGTKYTIEE